MAPIIGSLYAIALVQSASAQPAGVSIIPPQNAGAFIRGTNTRKSGKDNPIGQERGIGHPQSQVINGQEAPLYKHVVGISFTGPRGASICTGTLLTKRLVLTAAHCGCGTGYTVTQQLNMKDGPHIGVVGRPILFDLLACQRAAILPGYDLALLQLEREADVDDEFQPTFKLAFSLRRYTIPGEKAIVVGYGLTEQRTQGRRMEAMVPILTSDCAKLAYIAAGCAPFLEMIISSAGRPDIVRPTDTCSGDSGGPVFVTRDTADRGIMPTLFAVTSRPAPLPHTDVQNHCGGGAINTVIGRTDVLFWLLLNGVSISSAAQ